MKVRIITVSLKAMDIPSPGMSNECGFIETKQFEYLLKNLGADSNKLGNPFMEADCYEHHLIRVSNGLTFSAALDLISFIMMSKLQN